MSLNELYDRLSMAIIHLPRRYKKKIYIALRTLWYLVDRLFGEYIVARRVVHSVLCVRM